MTVRRLITLLLRAYQLTLSPFLGQHCRFYPSCSNYAIEAVERHGAVRGSWLSGLRLLRCHPWHPGGVDPVPAAPGETSERHDAVSPTSD